MKLRNIIISACVVVVAIAGEGCGSTQDTQQEGKNSFKIIGTMQFVDVEGGCWQFIGDDGTSYELAGQKANQLKQEGLRAELIVREFPGANSLCMVGKVVVVVDVVDLLN